jgi:hypothetical protein
MPLPEIRLTISLKPAHGLGVLRIHAKQVAGKNGGLVATRPGANLEVDVAVIVGVGRDQRLLQVEFEDIPRRRQRLEFFLAHLANVAVAVFRHLLRSGHVAAHGFVAREQVNDRLEARILH